MNKEPSSTARVAFFVACFAMGKTYHHGAWFYIWTILGALMLLVHLAQILIDWFERP